MIHVETLHRSDARLSRVHTPCLAYIARALVDASMHHLGRAGTETSVAFIQAPRIAQVKMGAYIDPACPRRHARSSATGSASMHLTFKFVDSGNDGFFRNAFAVLG